MIRTLWKYGSVVARQSLYSKVCFPHRLRTILYRVYMFSVDTVQRHALKLIGDSKLCLGVRVNCVPWDGLVTCSGYISCLHPMFAGLGFKRLPWQVRKWMNWKVACLDRTFNKGMWVSEMTWLQLEKKIHSDSGSFDPIPNSLTSILPLKLSKSNLGMHAGPLLAKQKSSQMGMYSVSLM